MSTTHIPPCGSDEWNRPVVRSRLNYIRNRVAQGRALLLAEGAEVCKHCQCMNAAQVLGCGGVVASRRPRVWEANALPCASAGREATLPIGTGSRLAGMPACRLAAAGRTLCSGGASLRRRYTLGSPVAASPEMLGHASGTVAASSGRPGLSAAEAAARRRPRHARHVSLRGNACSAHTGSLACCTRPAPKKGATSASPASRPELKGCQ